jgi:RNA polymerase sigma-70 factor (ECF subfamily)
MAEGGEPESDETLARRVQQGDRTALELLVRRYVRPVHAVIASFLFEPSQVDDAAQETFLRMLRAIDTYDARRPFAPWLYQVARNAARSQIAAENLRNTEPLPADEPSTAGPLPDSAAEQAEIRTRVERALEGLPEQRRVAFRLVDVEGMGAAEAGRIMGISAGAVRAHVHHARRQLREALAEYANVTDDERDVRHD